MNGPVASAGVGVVPMALDDTPEVTSEVSIEGWILGSFVASVCS